MRAGRGGRCEGRRQPTEAGAIGGAVGSAAVSLWRICSDDAAIGGYNRRKEAVIEMAYILQRRDWPKFRWNSAVLLPAVSAARFRQGQFLGVMNAAGFDAQLEAELSATSEDVIKTSALEGEVLNPASVR